MNGLPLAHAGHWLVSLLYLSPVLVVVGALGLQAIKERRGRGAESTAASEAE